MLFADLVGFTALSETRDPEQVKNLIDRFFERLVADVRAFGGRVDKFVGDGILALFGAPVAHEDDAERAVRAGLQMQQSLQALASDLGVDVRMRIGVNTGIVLVGALRAGGDYTAMGDVVNTAQRLQAQARPGQVVVGPETQAATRDVVSYEPLGMTQVRGREEPVEAFVALEAITLPGHRPPRSRTPLFGREDEIGMLLRALGTTVARNRPHLVLLLGEAGVGKSRLAEELSGHAKRDHEAFVLSGRCLPYGEANVWWPVAEALRQAGGIEPADSADAARTKCREAVAVATRLPNDSPEALRLTDGLLYFMGYEDALANVDPSRARDLAVVAVQEVLAGIARRHPVLLVLSELHWADPLVFDLLTRLLDQMRSLPLMIVATARPELEERWQPKPGRHNLLVVNLDPLDEAATSDLLCHLLGEEPSLGLRELLLERSGGNPFFLEELVALLKEAELSRRDQSGELHELPATLRGLVSARLDALGPSERSVLEDAAVLGRTGSMKALEALAEARGEQHCERLVQDLVARDLLLCEGDELHFKSDLVREVAYGTLTKAERARRHAMLADWLTQQARSSRREEEYLEQLAHHYGLSAELAAELGEVDGIGDVKTKALEALERAASRAGARDTHAVSLHLLDHAIRLVGEEHGAKRRRLLLARAQALAELRDLPAARNALAHVMGQASDAGDQAQLARGLTILGDVGWKEGNYSEALETLGRAVGLWEEIGDKKGRAKALRVRGTAHLFSSHLDAAEADFSVAIRLAEEINDSSGKAEALQRLAWIAFNRGDTRTAEERLHASAAIFTELGDLSGSGWAFGLLGFVRYIEGRREEAEEIALRILEQATRTGDRWAMGMMQVLLAGIRLWSGRTVEAVALSEEAGKTFLALGDPWAQTWAFAGLARGLAALGRVDDALAALDELTTATAKLARGSHPFRRATIAADVLVKMGETQAAAREAGAEDAGGDGRDEWDTTMAFIALQEGRPDDALEIFTRASGAMPSEGYHANVRSGIALAHGAAGRPLDALDAADAVESGSAATYHDRLLARVARGLALAHLGRLREAEAAFEAAVGLVDATEDRIAQAVARLAHGRALEALEVAAAQEVLADAHARLDAIGISALGWDAAFRLAATGGIERPARSEA